MSHHLDTPRAAQTGQLYIDDLYHPRRHRDVLPRREDRLATSTPRPPPMNPARLNRSLVHVTGEAATSPPGNNPDLFSAEMRAAFKTLR
jgi:hypothetical protein